MLCIVYFIVSKFKNSLDSIIISPITKNYKWSPHQAEVKASVLEASNGSLFEQINFLIFKPGGCKISVDQSPKTVLHSV